MRKEFKTGYNSDQGLSITIGEDGGNYYRPEIPIEGVQPLFTTNAIGSEKREGWSTLVPGALHRPAPKIKRRLRPQRTNIIYCPYIGIVGSGIDLFTNQTLVVTQGEEYGIATNLFDQEDTEWFNIVINGQDVEVLERNSTPLGSGTFVTDPPVYAGDVQARSLTQWFDVTSGVYSSRNGGLNSNLDERLDMAIGFSQYHRKEFPPLLANPPILANEILIINSGIDTSGPGGTLEVRIRLYADQRSTIPLNQNRNFIVNNPTYSIAGRSRNILHRETAWEKGLNGTFSQSLGALGGFIESGSTLDFVTFTAWDYRTIVYTNEVTGLERNYSLLGLDASGSGDYSDDLAVVENEYEPTSFYYVGEFTELSPGSGEFTLDTPIIDNDAYYLEQSISNTDTVQENRFIGQSPGSGITFGTFIDQIEAAPGWERTTYEVEDAPGSGNFIPISSGDSRVAQARNYVLDQISGPSGLEGLAGLSTTPVVTNNATTRHNIRQRIEIAARFIRGYLCLSNTDGTYNVYESIARMTPMVDEEIFNGVLPNVNLTTLEVSFTVTPVLENIPWWPNAVPNKDTWCSANPEAMGMTPQNTVLWSDMNAATVAIGGGID